MKYLLFTLLFLVASFGYGDSKTDTTIVPKKAGGAVILSSPSGATTITAGATNGTSGVTITSGSTSGQTLLKGNTVKMQTYSAGWLDRLTILSDGKVGIGTTASDTSTLKVNGTITTLDGAAAVPAYTFTNALNTGMWYAGSGRLAFSANASERMRILENGNVGLGTTTPAYRLTIGSNAGQGYSGIDTSSSSPNDYMDLIAYSQIGGWFGVMRFFTGFNATTPIERMRIDGTGVGIGKTPTVALDVNGGLAVSGAVSFPVTSLSDVQATAMGHKAYSHGTNYNGGFSPTISVAGGTIANQVSWFIPYQLQDGTWRLKFQFGINFTGNVANPVVAINGIVYYNNANAFYFPVYCQIYAGGFQLTYLNQNTNTWQAFTTTGTSGLYCMGDVQLNSKPSWAY